MIAERVSVRLIIVQARQTLVGSLSEVVFACLSVMGLRLKYTGLCILQHVSPLFYACAREDSSEDRR